MIVLMINLVSICNLEYRLISKKGEGTFSEVLQAQSIKSNKQVAIKCMKANFYNIEKVSSTDTIYIDQSHYDICPDYYGFLP